MNTIKTILVLILSAALFMSGCSREIFCKHGQGEIETRVLNISDFENINLGGAFDMEIVQADEFKVTAIGNGNIIDVLTTEVSNNTWVAELQEGCYKNYELTLYIEMPSVSQILINGSGDIVMEGFQDLTQFEFIIDGSGNLICNNTIQANEIIFKIGGSGDIQGNFISKKITSNISGSGNIKIGGSTIQQIIKISGSGDYRAFDLPTSKTNIEINGSGDCKINVSDILDVKISGSGNIYYIGHPVINSQISGSGRIIDNN